MGQPEQKIGRWSRPRNLVFAFAEQADSQPPSSDLEQFEDMLYAPCGVVVGGVVGGVCADCDWEQPLTTAGLGFGPIPLNIYVRFRTPGTYTCTASAADVTTALPDQKIRPALLVKSNPVVLTVVDDPAWAHSAGLALADAYDKLCRSDDVPEHRLSQCFDIAKRITYLDTPDSSR
jgi:hypothetical protein